METPLRSVFFAALFEATDILGWLFTLGLAGAVWQGLKHAQRAYRAQDKQDKLEEAAWAIGIPAVSAGVYWFSIRIGIINPVWTLGQPSHVVNRAGAMQTESDEPALPYTPSNTGRRAKVGYLGIEGVGFGDLWPLFLGAAASLALGLRFFVGGDGARHWPVSTLEAALPLAAGFGYLRLLVAGRPPHFKGDLWTTLAAIRPDFGDPPARALAIVPGLRMDAAASGPGRAADLVHPLRTPAERRFR